MCRHEEDRVPLMSRFYSLWRNVVHRDRVERDLDDELQSTFAQLVDEHVCAGLDPYRARREASVTLGGIESVKSRVRDTRHGAGLDTLLQDVRYAWRSLRRVPGFTTVTVVTLALGIGANTAMFTIVNAALIRPPGFPRPDRLVALHERLPSI